jgi:ppGpp synthetase/RelA/SpoT-type nucleotidyltranferase
MIPASLSSRYLLLNKQLEKLLGFMTKRIEADLSEVNLVSVTGRPKSSDSVLQKLHTGRYAKVDSLNDLVGITIVVLYRREVQEAISIVKASGLTFVDEPKRAIEPADFSYREPKLYLKPPVDYLDRNPDLADIVCEVQFTTALQHALDMTTHDFDYKGLTYSWENFRLVAQLRGMLELVDRMIDDIDEVSIANHEIVEAPETLVYASAMLEVLAQYFADEVLPSDRRRLADTTAAWTRAIGLAPSDFGDLLSRHGDLISAVSIDATSAILGAIVRENVTALLKNYKGNFCVSSELESLCEEARAIPAERRVNLA